MERQSPEWKEIEATVEECFRKVVKPTWEAWDNDQRGIYDSHFPENPIIGGRLRSVQGVSRGRFV